MYGLGVQGLRFRLDALGFTQSVVKWGFWGMLRAGRKRGIENEHDYISTQEAIPEGPKEPIE